MKVTHVRDRIFTVYIGRPSVLGNPYIIGVHGTRKEVIKKFGEYARSTERVLNAIRALKKNAILGCHCVPKPCHGEVIIAIYKSLRKEARAHATITRSADVSRVSRQSTSGRDLRRLQRKGRSRG